MPENFGDEYVTRLRIALSRTARELDRRAGESDLTRSEVWVLGSIVRHHRISLGDLAQYEGMHPTALSRCIRRLQEKKLIRRVADKTDRRVSHAEITAAGARLWERFRRDRDKLLAELIDGISEQQAATLRAAIPVLEAIAEDTRPPLLREHNPSS